MTIDVMSFAANLKRLMKARNVNARVVCEATGIPSSTLSEWAAGREPKLGPPVLKLAQFFGVSIEYLITGVDDDAAEAAKFIGRIADEFSEIHSGIYRIKIEKMKKGNE